MQKAAVTTLALLLLAMPVLARQPRPVPKATPAPATAQPLAAPVIAPAPAVPGVLARQRTAQEDAELRQWIEGIMTTAQDAEKRSDQAEAEAKASRDQGAIAVSRLMQADAQLTEIQRQYDALQKRVADLEEQHKKDVAQLKRFGKLVGIIAAIAATFAALYVFEMTKTGGAIALMFTITNPIHYGLPLLVWGIVFTAVEVYLRYVF